MTRRPAAVLFCSVIVLFFSKLELFAADAPQSATATAVLTSYMSQFPREACSDGSAPSCIALIDASAKVLQIPDRIEGKEAWLLAYKIDGRPLIPQRVVERIREEDRKKIEISLQEQGNCAAHGELQPDTDSAVESSASLGLVETEPRSSEAIATDAFLAEPSRLELASPKPEVSEPPKHRHRSLWVSAGFLVAGVVMDVEGTKMAEARGGTELNSWLFGRSPTRLRMYGTDAAAGAAMIWNVRRLKQRSPDKKHDKYDLVPISAAVAHFIAGLHTFATF